MSSEKTIGLWPLFTIYGCIVKNLTGLASGGNGFFSCISGSLGKMGEDGI
ncbi:enoyl-CoA hydratase [Neisseria macacae ATCC 33926]|uniref:Enoyl-CoA hydratase n=1 Tax=Neisseria macacae ATCC 33926 TaxID=997348 RepID=A0AA36ULG9_9NEIS|nr:enoyl-CoA hydratase [Neisseria macacae ATCC 33926]